MSLLQTAEAVARFMRCLTSRAVLETLEAAPEEAVTPAAAVFALKRVAALEQGVKGRRKRTFSVTLAVAEANDFLRCVNLPIIGISYTYRNHVHMTI